MEKEERLEMVREAKKRLEEVLELVEMAVDGTELRRRYEAYFLGNVRDWVGPSVQPGNLTELLEELEELEDVDGF